PRVSGVSSRSTERPILPSPSARRVPRCFCDWPIWLRVWVIFSFGIGRCLGGLGRCLGRCGLVGLLTREQDLVDCLPARLRDLFGPAQALEAVYRRLQEVDGVRVAQALREDVADAGELEDGADSAAGDDAG